MPSDFSQIVHVVWERKSGEFWVSPMTHLFVCVSCGFQRWIQEVLYTQYVQRMIYTIFMAHVNRDREYGGKTLSCFDINIIVSSCHSFGKVWSMIIFFRKIILPLHFKNITLKNTMIFIGYLTPIIEMARSLMFWDATPYLHFLIGRWWFAVLNLINVLLKLCTCTNCLHP